MSYTRQTWEDNNRQLPLSAARMQHIEDGLDAVANGGSIAAFNVLDTAYGVKDDGTLNDAALQAAINAANAEYLAGAHPAGVELSFPRRAGGGVYQINTVTPKSGVHFVFDDGVTLLQKTGATLPMFYWPQSPRTLLSNVQFRGGYWQGDTTVAAEATRAAIYLILGQDIIIDGVETHDFASAHVHVADVMRVWMKYLRGYGGCTVAGRNMFEIKSTQSGLTTPTAAAANGYAWITDSYAQGGAALGGSGPTAGFAIVASDVGVLNQAIISRCTARDFTTFTAIDVEAGLAVDTQVVDNQAYNSKIGINVAVTNRPSPGTEVVKQNVVADNIVDSETLALAAGIIYNGSKVAIGANVVRSSSTPLKVYGLGNAPAGDLRATNIAILPNQLTVCNTDSANRPFALNISGAGDVALSKQQIGMESGCYMKDGIFVQNVIGLDADAGESSGVGRDGIRLTAVDDATIRTGTILDANANADAANTAGLSLQVGVLTVNGDQTVAAGGTLTVSGGDVRQTIPPTGSIKVAGTSYVYTAVAATTITLTAGGSFTNGQSVTRPCDHIKVVLDTIHDRRAVSLMNYGFWMVDGTNIEVEGGGSVFGWLTSKFRVDAGAPLVRLVGTGSPNSVVTAAIGSTFLRTDGAAGSTLYVKESGTGNTGWTAINISAATNIYRASNIAVGPSVNTEVTLIDQSVAALGATSGIRCTIIGDRLNNFAATQTLTLRVYVGGTKVFDSSDGGISQSAARRALFIQMLFNNYGATNTNMLSGVFQVGGATAPTTGISAINGGLTNAAFASLPTTVDTSSAFNFKVTMQLGSSDVNLDARIKAVLLEEIP